MQLAKFIYTAAKEHNTSLGNNNALPKREDVSYEYIILKRRFRQIIDQLKDTFGYVPSVNEAEHMLGKIIVKVQKLEEPLRPQLEKLCEAVVTNVLSVPQETILLECNLVDEIEPEQEVRILPEFEEEETAYDFSDVDEVAMANEAILKRRMVNSLVQGVSYLLMMDTFDNSKLSEWSEELPGLYMQIIALNDYLLYTKQEKITDKNPMLGAYVETHLGKGEEKTVITSQGLVYPLMLQETFRGFFELFGSHGLPDGTDEAMYVIRHADFIVAEAWDLRIGVPLWQAIENCCGNIEASIYPYIFSSIAQLPIEDFNKTLQNIFLNTKSGRGFIDNIVREVKHDEEYNLFKQDLERFNLEKCVISDEEDSDEDLLKEGNSKRVIIQEGISDVTYHFCTLQSLHSILESGKLSLTMSSNASDSYHKTKLFYLSTQRSKSSKLGYSGNSSSHGKRPIARIELDGAKLMSAGFQGQPLDYWGKELGKQSDIGLGSSRVQSLFWSGGTYQPKTQQDKEAILKSQQTSSNFEFEDRIFSNKPSISLDYINRIDCLIPDGNIEPIEKSILQLAENRGVSVSFYDNEKDFVLETEHTLNGRILSSDGEYEKTKTGVSDEKRLKYNADTVAILSSALLYYNYVNNIVNGAIGEKTLKKLSMVLDKFGLGRYYDYCVDKLPQIVPFLDRYIGSSFEESLRKANTEELRKNSLSENVMLYAQYVFNHYGVNNCRGLRMYFKNHPYKKNRPKEVKLMEDVECVEINNGGGSYRIYRADTVPFWGRWFDKDSFYQDIARQLEEDDWNESNGYGNGRTIYHNSKDSESFLKYIQHLTHNDNLSLYDGAVILNKIFNHDQGNIYTMFGLEIKPITVDKEFFRRNENKFNFDDAQSVINSLFGSEDEYYKWLFPKEQ